MAKYAYLMRVDGDQNNNKFYIMAENDNGTFTATYGREGAKKPAVETYPMAKWDTKYREKLSTKKGYTDVTELRSVKQIIKEAKAGVISKDTAVVKLIELLQSFAKGVTAANYKVEAKEVTQAQVDAAQASLDKLGKAVNYFYGKQSWDINVFNKELTTLFTIIPRKMKNVKENLITPLTTETEIKSLIGDEQMRLDAMASQVTSQNATADDADTENSIEQEKTLLESLGLEIMLVTNSKEIEEVKKLAEEHGRRVRNVYTVVNNHTQKPFDEFVNKAANKTRKLLWHGSRVANWFSIIQQGLRIRPSNAVYTGSMFGDGVYFAIQADKSMGYTDSGRWVNGGQSVSSVFMALYDVHIGEYKEIRSHDRSCYELHKTIPNSKFDSTWAKKGQSLYRDEIIIYNSAQSTIKYLVEFSN